MYHSKLIQLIKALKNQRREILEFEKFVKSPYFNPKKEVVDLLLFIKSKWNRLSDHEVHESDKVLEEQEKIFDKKNAYRLIFPKEKTYKAWKINECIADLSMLLEDFFVMQAVRKNKQKQEIILIEALKERGIDKYYFKRTKKMEERFIEKEQSLAACDSSHYQCRAWLNEEVYYHPNHSKHRIEENNQRLKDMLYFLDLNFSIKKLQYACELYSRKTIFGFESEQRFMSEIRELAKADFADKPLLKAYASLLDLFITRDARLVPSLKKQIFDLVENSAVNCKFDLLIKFINAIPQIPDRLELFFEIYQLSIVSGVLIEDGFIAQDHFNNIFNLAFALNKEAWAKQFLKDNRQYLKIDKGEKSSNVVQLYNAILAFRHKDYQEAYRLLYKLKIKDVNFGLRYHILLVQTLVEGRRQIKFKYDFETKCQNFRAYLNRSVTAGRMTVKAKRGSLKFISISKKIYLWSSFGASSKTKLLEELDVVKDIPFRNWLEEKVSSL